MRKLTYVIAMMALLLTGCSQDESVMENKGELVTLNYNVSLGSGVQSRNGTASDLAINKLLCVVFENGEEVKRDIVSVENGTANYSPKLFSNIEYKIVFWAYYDSTPNDADINSCFDMADVSAIKTNTNYNAEGFTEDKHKDAYTEVHTVTLNGETQSPKVSLTRPFAQLNVLSTKADYHNAESLGSTPTTCTVKISGFANEYNALSKQWGGTATETTLTSQVSKTTVTINEKVYYYYASEYVFGNGTATTGTVTVFDQNEKQLYKSEELPSIPLGANQRTNLSNENLLTGGGVNYTITISQDFSSTENSASY